MTYVIKNKLKSKEVKVKLDRDYHPASLTHDATCSGDGDECANISIDGVRFTIIRDGAN